MKGKNNWQVNDQCAPYIQRLEDLEKKSRHGGIREEII